MQYNVLRKLVFDEITARGENVNDLIESKMDSTGLSYEKASREVVAEAMTDILPDSKFVKNMAEKHKSLFHKLVEKLKEFVADLRAYFDTIGGNRSAEANALKEQVGDTIKYIDSIVDMFDTVASEAVEPFQKAYAVEEVTEGISTVSEDESVNEDSSAAVKEKENSDGKEPSRAHRRKIALDLHQITLGGVLFVCRACDGKNASRCTGNVDRAIGAIEGTWILCLVHMGNDNDGAAGFPGYRPE